MSVSLEIVKVQILYPFIFSHCRYAYDRTNSSASPGPRTIDEGIYETEAAQSLS